MQEQKTKQNEVKEIESSLKLIGYCSIKGVDSLQAFKQQDILHEMISNAFNKYKKDYPFHPIKLYTTSNCIAIIDTKYKLWLIIDLINQPICISDMIKLKVNDLALSYNQMVLNTSEGRLLLSWGGKKHFCQKQLSKQTIKNQRFKYLHYFELYQIKKDCTKHDRFYYTHNQKIDSEAIIYHITKNNSILTYPSQSRIQFKKKIAGISLGKYHNLIWDQQGKLYSWGCRSIALGYEQLPENEIVEEPREVDLLKHHVIKAFAGSNYSLAVTLEGRLYQWGINKTNTKKQDIIFEPRQISQTTAKFIDLKGKADIFGVLSLTGQLYIWGKNSKVFNSSLHNKQDYIEPTLIAKNIDFIVDFTIQDSFILLITIKENLQTFSENRKIYWSNLKDSIQQNLKGIAKPSPSPSVKPRMQLSTFRKYNDQVEVAFEKRKAKQSYILSTLQPQKTIKYLMEPNEHSVCSSNIIHDISLECFNKDNRKSQQRCNSKRVRTTIDDFSNEFKKEKEYIQILVNKIQSMKVHPGLIRFNRNKNPTVKQQKTNDSYQAKLNSVRRRRDQNEHMFIEQTVRKVQNRSFQFRIAKKIQIQQSKKRAKECQLYKLSLQKFLIKQFMVKLLTKPIAEGRQAKITTFAQYLKIERLEKKIRGLFIRTRVRFSMRKLHHHQIFRFFLLTMTFQQYVKRFRLKKAEKLRKMVVGEIFKGVIRQKIKIGITACNFSIRKLQKFRQWLSLVKIERKRCLKYIWKVHLLSIMKINTDSQSSAIFYLPRNFEEMTFQALYQQKVCMNPLLKLCNFLNHHSIFRIKTTIFQQLFLLTKESKAKQKSSRMIKGLTKSRKFRIKFSQDDDDKQQRFNLIQTDILPYSLHYNIVIHPKNYDITIPQIMKVSQKWIRQQRRILDKHIELIIKNHQVHYLKERRKYDVDLAHFIRKNYEYFSQKRWKFIIQYNQIEKNHSKKKKEKQIRRIMKLIGAENILDQDCIPEKQIILDEVFKRTDAPFLPNPNINFGPSQFKKLFKSYYEAVACKSKALVRATLPL